MTVIQAVTPPLSAHDARQFAAYLREYGIQVKGVTLHHRYDRQDGVTDWQRAKSPGQATAEDLAGATAAGGSIGTVAGAATGTAVVAAGVVINPLIMVYVLIADLIALAAATWADYQMHSRTKGQSFAEGVCVESKIRWQWANVSPKREKWAEYLVCSYAVRHGWKYISGFKHNQIAPAARHFGKYQRNPTSWKERHQR